MASGFSTNLDDYTQYELNELTESYQYTKDRDLSAKIDFVLPLNVSGDWKNSISLGGAVKEQIEEQQ